MKYIRTKEGIFEVSELNDYATHHRKGMTLTVVKYVSNNKILKQADTIEELCDCLMFVDNDKQKDFLITDVNEDNINCYDNKKETCYGCIKVELPNGAIRIEPVAKLNENGELKLL